MSLPSPFFDEAAMRALEPRCASPHSADSTRAVAVLSGQPPELKESFLFRCVNLALPNLVRCALEAHTSADAQSKCNLEQPVLVQASRLGHTRIVKLLIEAGADLNSTNAKWFTPLCVASYRGRVECIEVLLAAGADVNKCIESGHTPLMFALMHKHTECVRVLLPSSDLSRCYSSGHNAFHVCVAHGTEECFEMMLPRVSDVDVRTLPGVDELGLAVPIWSFTPLHLARHMGQHLMAKTLLKRGADRFARDNLQRMPLFYAAQEGHLACAVLLLGQPGKFKMPPVELGVMDDDGFSALHVAAQQGHIKVCGVLIEAGARLDLKTLRGNTPLMLARQEHPTNAALLALLSGAGSLQPPGTVCDHCGKTAAQASVNNLKACSQCQAARYCGAACSVAAWPGHNKACKARAAEREEKTKPKIVD